MTAQRHRLRSGTAMEAKLNWPETITARTRHSVARLGYAFAVLPFVVGCDLYVIAPLLPEIRTAFDVTLTAAGLLVTFFTAGYTLASPLIGGLTDRVGRRAVLYAGLLSFIVFEAVSAWAPNFAVLLVGHALTGIAAAAITPTAYTIIGDAVPYSERGRVMSIASVGFSVSAIAGVPLGLWLSDFWSWRGVLWALTAATIAAAGGLAFGLALQPAAAQAAPPQPQRPAPSIDQLGVGSGRCSVSRRPGRPSASYRRTRSSTDISAHDAIEWRHTAIGPPVPRHSRCGSRRRVPNWQHNRGMLPRLRSKPTVTG